MYVVGSESVIEGGKIFTREVDDRSFSYGDFRLPVYHKRQWKWTHWKDIGKKMNIPMVSQGFVLADLPSSDVLSVLHWYQGFDEESGERYSYLHRANDSATDIINTLFGADITVRVEGNIEKLGGLGSSPACPVALSDDLLLSRLFLFQILWGKCEQSDDVLHGIKITIPLISSTMQYQETILTMVDRLRQMDIVIKMDEIQTDDGVVIQLASRDMCLLEQFVLWYKPLATWSVISTKDLTDSLVNSLMEFVGDDLSLPSGKVIKIGSVQ